ncbi:MAG: hypothetical protein HC859_09380 [Bacteroidia bacterium]|nr:hypothetical protein [Bacteroidia bacterium]
MSTPSNAPGYRQRNTGRALTIMGGVMLVTGVVLVSTADATYYNTTVTSSGTYEEGDPKGGFGTLMMAGGLGMTIPGIILWSKGSKRYNRYLEKTKWKQASMHTVWAFAIASKPAPRAGRVQSLRGRESFCR